ncbi:MAG: GIY-YIG nuclease family protein [Ignavibacteriae bacterium]|nr:GIY-YIG nuclease family protein [Ignavibacteriota bacterium]
MEKIRSETLWFAYILRSAVDGKRYVGLSDNVERRVAEHNAGHTQSTKSRRPLELLYKEAFPSRREARVREKYFKTAAGRRFLDRMLKKIPLHP